MKSSYLTRHGPACSIHLRRKSDLGSPVANTGLIHLTNSSTAWRPRSSNRKTRSLGDTNTKRKQGMLRMAAIRNVISDHPSPNLQQTLPAIPIIPTIPVIQNWASPISPVEAAMPTYHQRRGFQRMPTKAARQTGNALAASSETTKPTFVPNMASRTHLTRTAAITAVMMATKFSTKSHSTCSSKKTSLPLSISKSTGEARRHRVRIVKLGKLSHICNFG